MLLYQQFSYPLVSNIPLEPPPSNPPDEGGELKEGGRGGQVFHSGISEDSWPPKPPTPGMHVVCLSFHPENRAIGDEGSSRVPQGKPGSLCAPPQSECQPGQRDTALRPQPHPPPSHPHAHSALQLLEPAFPSHSNEEGARGRCVLTCQYEMDCNGN